MNNSFHFGEEQFNRLFPFFILVNRGGRITSFGRTLAKLCTLEQGAPFQDIFIVKRPETHITSLEVLQDLQNQLVVIEYKPEPSIVLRGQFEYLADDDCILFIGSPWFGSMDQVTEKNLTLHDFAYHDPMIDLLHLLKTHEIVNDDIKKLLHTVNKQRKDLKQLSLVVEQTSNAVIITDEKGYIEWVNNAFSKISGYTLEEARGLKPGDFLQGADTDPATIRYMGQQIAHGLPFNCELINYTKEQKPYWTKINAQPIQDKSGKIVQFFALMEDVTQQKNLELEIKSSASRMATLISNLHAGILLEDQNRSIKLINQQFCDLFGIPATPEQLIGYDCSQSARETMHLFKAPEQFTKRIEDLLQQRKPAIGDRLDLVDGRVFERDFIPIWTEGVYHGHLWVYTDLTEKVRAQKAILESEEKYRGIMENMELGLLEVDLNQKILRPYQAFCDMLGYSAEELIGKHAAELLLPEQYRPLMEERNNERIKGQSGVYELQLRRKDGSLMWALVSGAPIKNAQGVITGSLGIHFDLTSRKQLEHELAGAKRSAEQARLAERQFLANMSHEIRTPMNAVIGMTHLLYETNPSPVQKEYLDSLRFSADNLMGLIDNILDLSKIEAGELGLEVRTFDLLQLLKSLQKAFQFKVRDKAISVVMDFDPAIRNLVIGDPNRLNQIINNLLGNASKFTERGTIGLQTKLLQHTNERYLIEFRVFDTGIGIPRNKQSDIFGYFKQADVQTTRRYGGTGLGLTIVKQLVELQGGDIRVESESGKGATFIFTLPFQISETNVSDHIQPEIAGRQIGDETLKSLDILAVEDNQMNRKLISRILENWGCQCQLAGNGLEALRLSREKRFNVILMDIHMPEMDGNEATFAIRNDPENPNANTPIIALTASALLEEKKRALESGMNDFLSKPFSPDMLKTRIMQVLGIQAASGQQESADESFEATDPVVDLQYLSALSGGDSFFIRDMIEVYLSELPQTLEHVKQALENQNWEMLYRIVHKLKPNFGMLGMVAEEEKSAAIEAAIKTNKIDPLEMSNLVSWLVASAKRSVPILEQHLVSL